MLYHVVSIDDIEAVRGSFYLLGSYWLQPVCNHLAIHCLQIHQSHPICHSWNIQTSLNTSQISNVLFLLLVLGAVILLY